MVFDANDKAVVRNAPAYDRWQDVRLPETVAEADAAIVLARMKVDALASRASMVDPERASELQYAADRWDERLVKLQWAREVLRAGASPWATKYDELKARYDHIVRLAAECPDTRTLIDTLLHRVQRANGLLDQWRFDRTIAEEVTDEVTTRLKAKADRLTLVLAERDAEIAALKVTLAEKQRETDAPKVAAVSAPPMTQETRAMLIAHMHGNEARALFVIDEVITNRGEHTAFTKRLTHNAVNGLPAGFYETWVAETLPQIRARMAERDAENGVVAE